MKNKRLNYFLVVVFFLLLTESGFAQSRERINIDKQWKFHLGHAADPAKDFNYGTARLFAKTAENYGTCIVPTFDDSNWEDVNVPHDWAVTLPFEYTSNGDVKAHGYKPIGGLYPQNSIGWYRKKFTLDAQSDTTRRVVITFDGVFRNSQVWVNNFYCGTHFSGYTGFSYDITDFVRYGKENVVVVRVDASQYEGWFYEGAGIYRHAWLNLFDNLHFTENGVFVYANLNSGFSKAELTLQTEVENTNNTLQKVSISTTVFDQNGKQIAQTDDEPIQLLPNRKCLVEKKLTVNNPELWDINSPKRYKAVSVIKSNTKIIDQLETRFGIRDIRIDKDKGLFLNGKNIKIQGVCCHQDHAGLGSALPDYLQYYRIGLLKEMGVNAYRTSHNPPTPELLEACDSLGMLALDETRLLNSSAEYMSQLKALVLRDRNHPSVFMWSIGNEEEVYQTKIEGERIAQSMIRMGRSLDPSRTITYGANVGSVNSGVNKIIPVRGFNYNLHDIDDYRKARPDQPIFGSEVASTVTTRGIYTKDTANCYLTDFDENYPPWASTAESWWKMAAERDWFMGGFAWTGFDYRGEPTPYDWPNINSHFGIMDVCGFPKNVYYYYQSWWTDKDVLHIAPHWNWQGKEGQPIKIWVNSNAQTVELYLNGKSLGKKEMPRNGHLNWEAPYKAGKLKAVAYKDGRKIERTIETTGKPSQIVLSPSKSAITADGKDAVVVNVSVLDEKGREVPDANELITFSLSGDAKIIGVGNGDPSCHQPDKCTGYSWQRSLFNGKCQLILQAGSSKSTIHLTAVSNQLKSTIITFNQQ
jgi:beta-galactosidase